MNIIKDKVIYSPLGPKAKPPNKSFIDRVLSHVRHELKETGDRDWLVDTETELTISISQIEPISRRVAAALFSHGFRADDVLQMGYSSCLDFYWPVFGAWLCGGVASMGDPNLGERAIKQQILDTRAKVVVCSKQYLDKYVKVLLELQKEECNVKLFVLDAGKEVILPDGVEHFQNLLEFEEKDAFIGQHSYDPNSKALIVWSSGSTGVPKGIVFSQLGLNNISLGKQYQPKMILLSLIMFHIGGFSVSVLLSIFEGAVCYFIKKECFSEEIWFKSVEKFQLEHAFCGISQYTRLSNVKIHIKPLDGLKVITPLGGSVSSQGTLNLLNLVGHHVSIIEMYGSSEVTFISSYLNKEFKSCVLGVLNPGVEMYFADRETGVKLGPGQKGKIMIKNESMMLYYLDREEETKEFYSSDGYGYMGDVGYYDATGAIYYSYRMREVLKVSGCWFGPLEIENALEQVYEINEAFVWGDYDPNTGNDKVNVGIVLQKGAVEWTAVKIKKYVEENLPESRHITGKLYFVESLPHNPAGKKLRGEMRKFVENIECS